MLKKKRALVTGGTSGIGKAIAIAYAEKGADVAILGTNEERAKKTLEELQEKAIDSSQRFSYFLLDIASFSAVSDTVSSILQEWGGIDILVNSAGITKDSLFLRMKEEDFDQVIAVNLKSIFNTCKAVSRSMVKMRKGKIINISSVIGLMGNIGQVNYAASKAAIHGFTKSLALEWANLGKGSGSIQVNTIAPGFIQTPMTDKLSEEIQSSILSKIPMGTWGKPSDVAKMALFLASEDSDYITGQIFAVDGGLTMQ